MAIRGVKPRPTYLKLLEGNPGKRALPANEPKPEPLKVVPDPPSHLSPEAREEWARLAPVMVAQRLLTAIDVGAFASYCQAYGRWVQAERAITKMRARDELTDALMIRTTGGNAIQNPLVGVANRAHELMLKTAIEFGMTPSARTRVEGGSGAIGTPAMTSPANAFARNGRRP